MPQKLKTRGYLDQYKENKGNYWGRTCSRAEVIAASFGDTPISF